MSDYGLRIHDAASNVTMDATTGQMRTFGATSVAAGGSGSVTNAMFNTASMYYVVYPTSIPTTSSGYYYPSISYTAPTLSWGGGPSMSYRIHYGAFAQSAKTASASGTYGLVAVNSSGVTQIDNQYSNLFLAATTGISLAAGASTTFSVTGSSPIFAYRGTGQVSVTKLVSTGTNTWNVTIQNTLSGAANGTVYCFDTATFGAMQDSSNYGLRLHDGSGNLVYDSRMKPAQVTGTGTLTVASASAGAQTAKVSGTVAVLMSTAFVYDPRGNGATASGSTAGDYAVCPICCGVNGTTLSWMCAPPIAELTSTGSGPGAAAAMQYWLVDVTNV